MKERKQFFVTGTDTDAGKTYFTSGLLEAAVRAGLQTVGLKPIAAGADSKDGTANSDAIALQEASNSKLVYQQINPVLLKAAIAPHIAAQQEGKRITASRLSGYVKGALLGSYQLALVEGAGGWRVPLNEREMMSDLAIDLKMPVILVVPMRLGCLNHALLSAEAIVRDGLPFAGWVANGGGDMPVYQENLETLRARMPGKCLGVLSWDADREMAKTEFDHILSSLLLP